MKDKPIVRDDRRPLTPEEIAQLEALAALPDDQIDLSDIPEVTDWSGAVRGKHYKDLEKFATVLPSALQRAPEVADGLPHRDQQTPSRRKPPQARHPRPLPSRKPARPA